ncbi:histidinol-phosphatase HisJ family protein [Extibacter muris]|uniref:Histidinol-phosphatase n=1 Tax=Extibacter muris TaxID=1796622 RepID=A0A4R4FK46_9FIRM|nr:histidinol-phosphatase HisJ family protein [Extibacter muris]MCU0080296.1 histidinol-phosphatase HisJ family protein [Extibacter muris]TDA23139.1 histidinol-phosphatase HisJ family protein [Extibacter muris]
MRADVHMHTSFSHDSKAAPEEMVLGAIDKGLEIICFTDHYDKDEMEWGEESIFDPEEYFNVLRPLQEKYRGRIDIRIGVELGLLPYLGDYYRAFTDRYPFDFVIGSVHSVQSTDPAAGKLFEGKTDEEAYRIAFAEILTDIRSYKGFDVLGHLDYVVRYGAGREKAYVYDAFADIIDEILRQLISDGKGLELNTAGLKYGLPFAHPHPDVLRRYRELGGEIVTIGADAHCPEHIAYDFKKAEDILKSCGFTYYTEFSGRTPVFKQLP